MADNKGKKESKQNKKRGFLKSVSLAVTALLSATPFMGALGIPNVDNLSSQNKTDVVSVSRTIAETEPLLITPASQRAYPPSTLQHQSHYSHYSHESHFSHQSHESHYSHYSASVI